MSRYDYRDPGEDRAYCDGISGEWCRVCGFYVENCICPALEPDDYPVCRFCGQPLPTDPKDYYCDILCEQRAIQESEEGK
jgi:hypothetical protein